MLAVALDVLARVHSAVMAALRAPPSRLPGGELLYANWDVRHALATERQKVRARSGSSCQGRAAKGRWCARRDPPRGGQSGPVT